MATRPVGRGAQPLRLSRAHRNDLVERTMEVQSALDQAAFLVANTTPEVDCLLDAQRLETRLHAQLARAIAVAKGETHIIAGELEAVTP